MTIQCKVFYSARPVGALGILYVKDSVIVNVSDADIAKNGNVECAARMLCIDAVYQSGSSLEHVSPDKVELI